MGTQIELTAGDGHKLGAYKAEPSGKAKGAVVVIQEIFGVNQHVRNVADQYAAAGYVAIAPALFDRVEKGLEVGYGQDDFQKGRETRQKLTDDGILADVQAAIDEAKKSGKVGIVGYCFGGAVAWMAACHCSGLAASSCYYGGGIHAKKDDAPKCPVQMHFGDKDGAIPLNQVHEIKEAHPDIPVYVYDDAGHGFCCDERDSFNEGACRRARERTLALFGQNVG
jgi:carboxymethylenebutenolidase